MHKLLLMGHDQAAMRWLGRITASKAPIEERMQEYSAELPVLEQRDDARHGPLL